MSTSIWLQNYRSVDTTIYYHTVVCIAHTCVYIAHPKSWVWNAKVTHCLLTPKQEEIYNRDFFKIHWCVCIDIIFHGVKHWYYFPWCKFCFLNKVATISSVKVLLIWAYCTCTYSIRRQMWCFFEWKISGLVSNSGL